MPARRAHAEEFILGLADQQGRSGYDTLVGERGVKLSGGQRQRIAIARAILKNAPYPHPRRGDQRAGQRRARNLFRPRLHDLMQGKTVLAIAHRLSTIAGLDRLVVIDQGRIVEGRRPPRPADARRAVPAAVGPAERRVSREGGMSFSLT